MGEGGERGDGRRADSRGVIDWTLTPAKWGAVSALALLGCMGLAWSVIRGEWRNAAELERAREAGRAAAAVEREWEASGRAAGEPASVLPLMASTIDESAMAEGEARDGGAPPAPAGVEGAAGAPPPSVELVTGPEPATPDSPDPRIAQRVNINTATEAELQALPGIGEARARAIVADRQVNGPFRSVEELDRVRGIGPGIIEGLREFARVR